MKTTLLLIVCWMTFSQVFARSIGLNLFGRQSGGLDPSVIPQQCSSQCSGTVALLNDKTCSTLTCICTQTNGNNLKSCVDCLYDLAPSAAMQSQGQTILDQFNTQCASQGVPSLTLDTGSPATGGSSGSATGGFSDSATGGFSDSASGGFSTGGFSATGGFSITDSGDSATDVPSFTTRPAPSTATATRSASSGDDGDTGDDKGSSKGNDPLGGGLGGGAGANGVKISTVLMSFVAVWLMM